MSFIVAIGCWVAVAGIVIVVAVLLSRRRSRSWEVAARRLGFTYREKGTPFEGTDVRGLSVLDGDTSTAVANLVEGSIRNCPVFVFDLPICSASTEIVTITTVAAFRSCRAPLPILQIAEKHVLDRLGEALTHRHCPEIDRNFDKQFVVHCANEAETRAFLTQARIQHLREYANHFRIESSPDWLLIYHPGMSIKPQDMYEFVEAASTVASALLPTEPIPVQVPA